MLACSAACDDPRLVGVGIAVGDVVSDGAAEQLGVLTGDRDVAPPAREIEVGEADAVDPDLAGGRIVQPAEQVDQGRLAGAGAADQGDGLTPPDLKREVGERRASLRALVIGEPDPVEDDPLAEARERHMPRGEVGLVAAVEQGCDLGDRRGMRGHAHPVVVVIAKVALHAKDQEQERQQDRQADRGVPCHQERSEQQRNVEQIDQRLHRPPGELQPALSAPETVRSRLEAGAFPWLLSEDADDAHAVQGLENALLEGGVAVLDLATDALAAAISQRMARPARTTPAIIRRVIGHEMNSSSTAKIAAVHRFTSSRHKSKTACPVR